MDVMGHSDLHTFAKAVVLCQNQIGTRQDTATANARVHCESCELMKRIAFAVESLDCFATPILTVLWRHCNRTKAQIALLAKDCKVKC